MTDQAPAFEGAIAWLDAHINYERTGPQSGGRDGFAHDPERRLRHLRRFMELMDEPQRKYPAIHLTGTNGKTSTARMISTLVLAQGLTAGLYTSPHLERINERIIVNDEPISDSDLAEVLETLRLLEPLLVNGDDEPDLPSYFELLTAAAFRHFADAPVDVGVVEVGVGGLWDATNVVDGSVAVITNIGLDHAGYLGPTRRDVATHKAGIIKAGATAVISEPDAEFFPLWDERRPGRTVVVDRDFGVLRNEVAVGGRLLTLRTPATVYEDVFLSLHGAYQGANAATAVTAAEELLGQPIADDVVRQALGAVTSPGRMEVVQRQPLCVIDGAHNVAGATALSATLDEEFGARIPRVLVVGMLQGHEPVDMLPALDAGRAHLIVACTAPSPRAVPAGEIAKAAEGLGAAAVVVEDVGQAVAEALARVPDDGMVVVTGSLYVAGAARTALRERSQLP